MVAIFRRTRLARAEADLGKGERLFKAGKLERALDVHNAVLTSLSQIEPRTPETDAVHGLALLRKAKICQLLDLNEEALGALGAAHRLVDIPQEAIAFLAESRAEKGEETEDDFSIFVDYLRLCKSPSELIVRRLEKQCSLRPDCSLEEASLGLERCLEVLEARDDFEIGHYYAGVALRKLGRFKEAHDHLEKASSPETRSPDIESLLSYCRGLAQEEQGNREEALAALERACQFELVGWEAHLTAGRLTVKSLAPNLMVAPPVDAVSRKTIHSRSELFGAVQMNSTPSESGSESLKVERARAYLKRAVDVNDSLVEGYVLLGDVCALLGRLDSARDAFSRAIELAPNETQYVYHLVLIPMRRGRLRNAKAELRESVRNLDDTTRRLLLGCLFALTDGLKKDAEGELRAVLSSDPGNALALIRLGVLAFDAGRFQEAAEHLTEIASDYPTAAYYLARCLGRTGKLKEAIELSEGLAKRCPDDWRVFRQIGCYYGRLGEYERALQSFDKALSLDASCSKTLLQRGHVLMRLGRPEASLADYRRALEIGDLGSEVHYALGCALEALNEFAEAESAFGQVVSDQPDNIDAHFAMAALMEKRGNLREAQEQYGIVLDLIGEDPSSTDSLALKRLTESRLCVTLCMVGKPEEAIELLESSADHGEPSEELNWQIGLAHYRKGNHAAAAEAWGKLQHQRPEDKELDKCLVAARCLAAREHVENGQYDSAEPFWAGVAEMAHNDSPPMLGFPDAALLKGLKRLSDSGAGEQWSSALDDFRSAFAKAPDALACKFLIGTCNLGLGDHAAAKSAFQALLSSEKAGADAEFMSKLGLALSQVAERNWLEAADLLRALHEPSLSSASAAPKRRLSRVGDAAVLAEVLAICLLNCGKTSEAQRFLTDRLSTDSGNERLKPLLGFALGRQNRIDEAMPFLEGPGSSDAPLTRLILTPFLKREIERKAVASDWAGASEALGRLLAFGSEHEEVKELLERFGSILPAAFVEDDNRGRAAEVWRERIVNSLSDSPAACHNLAVLHFWWAVGLQARGQTEDALKHYRLAISYWAVVIHSDDFWKEWASRRQQEIRARESERGECVVFELKPKHIEKAQAATYEFLESAVKEVREAGDEETFSKLQMDLWLENLCAEVMYELGDDSRRGFPPCGPIMHEIGGRGLLYKIADFARRAPSLPKGKELTVSLARYPFIETNADALSYCLAPIGEAFKLVHHGQFQGAKSYLKGLNMRDRRVALLWLFAGISEGKRHIGRFPSGTNVRRIRQYIESVSRALNEWVDTLEHPLGEYFDSDLKRSIPNEVREALKGTADRIIDSAEKFPADRASSRSKILSPAIALLESALDHRRKNWFSEEALKSLQRSLSELYELCGKWRLECAASLAGEELMAAYRTTIGDLRKAMEHYKENYGAAEALSRCYEMRASAYASQLDYEGAIADLERALEHSPQSKRLKAKLEETRRSRPGSSGGL